MSKESEIYDATRHAIAAEFEGWHLPGCVEEGVRAAVKEALGRTREPTKVRTESVVHALTPDSLVGSFFHSGSDRGWQGVVVAEPAPTVYLVETFSWMIPDSTHQELITLRQMADEGWHFYDDADWMTNTYEQSVERRWDRERAAQRGETEPPRGEP